MRVITAIKPNVSISNPCPRKDTPEFPEKSPEIKYMAGNAHATTAIPLLGKTISPLFNFEIKNKKNATRMLTKIKSDFVNENGIDNDGIKKIGKRNMTPIMK